MLTRRKALVGLAAAAAFPFVTTPGARTESRALPFAPARKDQAVTHDITLIAAPRQMRLLGDDGPLSELWTYSAQPFQAHRIRHGDRVRATLVNTIAEHTSIHWHGVRVPNDMDGVQYVTQKPVEPGERFVYEFTPPDTGTFFFHPHCNESGQVGHGLAGVLIVEGDESEPYDGEFVLISKDWRLNPDGSFLPFETKAGAAKAGTFGTVRTVNGQRRFTAKAPAAADIRLRLLNLDSTRTMEVGVEGGPGAIIAIDGNPVPPLALDTWRIGAAGRIDLVVRTPEAGQTLRLIDYNVAKPFILAELVSDGPPLRQTPFGPAPLYASNIPAPDLAACEAQSYVFGAASDSISQFVESLDPDDPMTQIVLDELCTGSGTFWAINKLSWPNDSGHRKLPPPLARLTAGKSYRFTLQNVTPHPHPIHLHGHTFTVLGSSNRDLPVHQADTVLLLPKERIDIAFVATPGKWMFHCHILEHLETGMMGYFTVA